MQSLLVCKAFLDLSLTEYCDSPAELTTLPVETRRGLRRALALKYRQTPDEGVLWLLVLVTPLPETELASPSEMVEWIGRAALRSREVAAYVLGRLRNRQQQALRRQERERDFTGAIEEKTSALAQLEAIQGWASLSALERGYLVDAMETDDRAALALKWRLSLSGAKKRLLVLRRKIKNL